MHMIPTREPAARFNDLPRDPQPFAAALWAGTSSPESVRQTAAAWIKAVMRPVGDSAVAMEAIAWAIGLPQLKKIVAPEDWLALIDLLSSLSAEVDRQTLKDNPLVHQLLAGELALTLARRVAETSLSRRLERSGKAAIALGLNQIPDRQGMLPANHYRILRPLLACWTRCHALSSELMLAGWGVRADQQYQRFVRNAMRCTRPDGRPMLDKGRLGSPACKIQPQPSRTQDRPAKQAGQRTHGQDRPDVHSRESELLEPALERGLDETNRSIAAIALPKMAPPAATAAKKATDLPPASIHWEEGAIAILRRSWNREDERAAVLFAGQTCELELVASGRVAASGVWRFEVDQEGRRLAPESDWESICWYTDDDIDYLELEIALAAGVKLQRHIVLARKDRFLLLADAVMSPQAGPLEYRCLLPLSAQVQFRAAEEGREGLLVQGRPEAVGGKTARFARSPSQSSRAAVMPLAQVMPLALPEWRNQTNDGELKETPEGLELRQTAAGQRLFAPMFIDLDRGRFRRRMTWRQLTVAESLTAVSPDTAVGYRIAVGKQQWLIYRSLANRSNRTVLGHNLATESLIARFGKDGEITPIVEIE